MYNSNLLQFIVWKLTEFFFIIFLIMSILFFLLKAYNDFKKRVRKEQHLKIVNTDYKNTLENMSLNEMAKSEKSIGLYLSSIQDKKERIEIISKLEKTEIFDNLYEKFKNKNSIFSQFLFFSSLTFFGGKKIRELSILILSNHEKRKKIPNFTVLALYGLAQSTRTHQDLKELYKNLEYIDSTEYVTQKFSEFFFIESLILLDKSEIKVFIIWLEEQKMSIISYGFIYSLKFLAADENILDALFALQKRKSEDSMLLVSILRLCSEWHIKDEELVLRYHAHEDNIVRIVLARIALDMFDKSNFSLLAHYLYDENLYVRRNFLLSLASHHIPVESIQEWTKNHLLDDEENKLLSESLLKYTQGVL